VQKITRTYAFYLTETEFILTSIFLVPTHHSSSWASGNHFTQLKKSSMTLPFSDSFWSEITQHLSFCACPPDPSMFLQMNFFLSKDWIVFHCVSVPYVFYSFIHWLTLSLSPYLGYCNKHGMCKKFFNMLISIPLNLYLVVGSLDHMVILFFVFLRHLHTIFHNGFILNYYQKMKVLRTIWKSEELHFMPHMPLIFFVFSEPSLSSNPNWRFSCLSLPSAGITGVHYLAASLIFHCHFPCYIFPMSHFRSMT
jgi:hypothetical protein